MSSNLKVNKRSQKSFSVTRFSGFDGSRVQITTARDHRKDHDVSDKFFDSVNLNVQEAKDLVETLMGFINGTDNECYDSVPLQVQENQWKRDNNKTRPGTKEIVGYKIISRPFSDVLVENQKKLSGNDRLYFNSRRMGTMWGTKFSEGEV